MYNGNTNQIVEEYVRSSHVGKEDKIEGTLCCDKKAFPMVVACVCK
jgi:hypothetical protein